MVQKVVHATYTETYDLNTAIGELSMLGIHTPQAISLKKMFKGFFEQYKKYKILGCNMEMVCASQQALTPDLVGIDNGQVDPRDILNPILFKACTGESLNALLDQIYNKGLEVATQGAGNGSVAQHIITDTVSINAYYQMLADDTFRKSHPQRGLTVMGLKPYVHRVVTTQPFKWSGRAGNDSVVVSRPIAGSQALLTDNGPDDTPPIRGFGGPTNASNGAGQGSSNFVYDDIANPSVFVSDGITEMPWLETTTARKVDYEYQEGELSTIAGKFTINDVPRVYMGCIILPPAILQRLFFRLNIVWHIEFKDFRPAYEVGPVQDNADIIGPDPSGIASTLTTPNTTYFNIYHDATTSSKIGNDYSSFATSPGTEVETVLEKVA